MSTPEERREIARQALEAATPDEERGAFMTVGMALKLARLTIGQACEQAYRDAELMLRDSDATRQNIEDARSRHRNGNRVLVLCVALLVNLSWSFVMLRIFHTVTGAVWTSSVAAGCDILVTAYAWKQRY